jgi:thiol:disulfide interchange protein DsbA
MQRRAFSRSLLAAGAASAGVLALPALAQAPVFKEGSDYLRLGRPAPVDSPAGQIEVVEFFAYTCIHCYNFEPLLADWIKKKPAGVTVRRTPVKFSDAFAPLQRLYYSLEAMGQIDALHEKVFRSVFVEKQRLTDPAVIQAWAEKQGLDGKKFAELYNSFSVAGKCNRATQLQDAYGVEGTPALGIAGRFYIPGQGPRTLQIAEALIAQVRKG